MEPYVRQIGLEAENIGCDRAGAAIVRGVSFKLAPGDALKLFGPNGSGKSSLLTLFAGLVRPVEGELIWISGADRSAAPFQHSLFFLGHDASIKLSLTGTENLIFWARTYGADRKHIEDALRAVNASEFAGQRAARLSAGQRRRLDLARAILSNRPVWLLDEPAAAIDRAGVELIRDLMARHRERGGVAIIATHDDLGPGYQRLELAR